MSMNKKEQAAFDAAIIEAKCNRALSWSPLPVPERTVMPPQSGGFTTGWTFNVYSNTVSKAWSESTAHGFGEYPADQNRRLASQGRISLYATELDALLALRAATERDCATRLMGIDQRIETAMKERQG